jgi:phospholipase C
MAAAQTEKKDAPDVPAVTIAPASSAAVSAQILDPAKEPVISHEEKLKLIRAHVKYLFVLFQENRSFDFYFGSYPGADGLYAGPMGANAVPVPGFTQMLVNTDGTLTTVTPFKIPATVTDAKGKTMPIYPADIASVNHSHAGIARKLALDANGVAQNTQYALTEEGVTVKDGKPSKAPNLAHKQMGELVMAHVDCDTVPFLWRYADRFTLFDHFMDTIIGPSTPNAIAMIAGQGGETQWMLHPDAAKTGGDGKNGMVPMIADPAPFWGSPLDKEDKLHQPNSVKLLGGVSKNLTFATLPLSFMGSDIKKTTAADYDPAFDLPDVQDDIEKIAGHGVSAVNWGWYQQGYDHERNDAEGKASHEGYVAHHNAPQYFGYVANNPLASTHLHGLTEFFGDVAQKRLPASGVFYVRGGYGNIEGLQPQDPNPDLAKTFWGNDDHPGYSDSQISEALIADEVNAIAKSPYWAESAIIIAYDESDGLYDHAQPRIRSYDADGVPLEQGPRIPAIVISPYAVAHGVAHEPDEHSSIIKLVDELFGLIPLADLPDEERARAIGEKTLGQKHLGPADDKVEYVGDMSSAFDTLRLQGKKPILSAEYATIPAKEITSLPHDGGQGCKTLGITPTDSGMVNPVPADFNPRPDRTPGIPTSGTWIP